MKLAVAASPSRSPEKLLAPLPEGKPLYDQVETNQVETWTHFDPQGQDHFVSGGTYVLSSTLGIEAQKTLAHQPTHPLTHPPTHTHTWSKTKAA